jgi:hypothetical protein
MVPSEVKTRKTTHIILHAGCIKENLKIITRIYYVLKVIRTSHPILIMCLHVQRCPMRWVQHLSWRHHFATVTGTGAINRIHALNIKCEGLSRSFWTGCLEWELQMVQLSATNCRCIFILWVSLVNFAAITLCVASERVIPKVSIYFVINLVWKLLNTPSYTTFNWWLAESHKYFHMFIKRWQNMYSLLLAI